MIVQILPKTENFTYEEKKDDKFQNAILSKVKQIEFSNPMYIDSEAVVVECGSNTNLFVRNIPNENIKKQTPPKKPLDVLVIYLDAVSR